MLNAKYSCGCSHTWGGRGAAFLLRGRNGLVTSRKGFPGGSGCPLRSFSSWVSHFALLCWRWGRFAAEKWLKCEQVCVCVWRLEIIGSSESPTAPPPQHARDLRACRPAFANLRWSERLRRDVIDYLGSALRWQRGWDLNGASTAPVPCC